MANRTVKLKELRSILKAFDCWEVASQGKGSHTTFKRNVDGKVFTYSIPTKKDVLVCYTNKVRRKLKLTKADGITDEDFYSKM